MTSKRKLKKSLRSKQIYLKIHLKKKKPLKEVNPPKFIMRLTLIYYQNQSRTEQNKERTSLGL